MGIGVSSRHQSPLNRATVGQYRADTLFVPTQSKASLAFRSAEPTRPAKTLVVEDEGGTRALVKRIVQQSSTLVLEAANGLDALSVIEREDPDLVITDLRMPLLDGFELIAALRRSPAHVGIPIICLTSVDQRADIARLVGSGVTDYVLKPVKPADLMDRVRRAFQSNANWRQQRSHRAAAGLPASDRLREQVLRDSNAWLISAARHAFGVVTGQKIAVASGDTLRPIDSDASSAVRLNLSDATVGVRVRLSCGASHAATLASDSAQHSPNCDGAQILGKLAAMIGCEVGVGLRARGFQTANPTPDVDVSESESDVVIGLQTPNGQRLALTVGVVERAARTSP